MAQRAARYTQSRQTPEVGGMQPSRRLLIQGVGLQEPALGQWGEWPGGGGLRGGQRAADGLLCGIEHVTQCGLQRQQYSNINLNEGC